MNDPDASWRRCDQCGFEYVLRRGRWAAALESPRLPALASFAARPGTPASLVGATVLTMKLKLAAALVVLPLGVWFLPGLFDESQPVKLADEEMLNTLNGRIKSKTLKNRQGQMVEHELSEALVREDGQCVYLVDDGIPNMLIDERVDL